MYSAPRTPGAPARIFGPAITVEMVEVSDTTAPSPERHFVDNNEEGGIMYIKQPPGLISACWGGLMSTRAKYLGAKGVVVDGRIRDVEEHREMGFPVRAAFPLCLGLLPRDRPLLTVLGLCEVHFYPRQQHVHKGFEN